jgi:hypothetical protein
MAYFSLGNLEYRAKSFKDALNWYEKITERDFHDKDQKCEYQFKKGYCYFLRNEYFAVSKNLHIHLFNRD